MNRYELKQGNFGYYFFDTISEINLSLRSVLELLNKHAKLALIQQNEVNNHEN